MNSYKQCPLVGNENKYIVVINNSKHRAYENILHFVPVVEMPQVWVNTVDIPHSLVAYRSIL